MDFQHIEATFGKLEHCSLSFSSGLNIIEAPNESGKSTLLAFLRVMLYGFPPRERGALADKNRYAPWSLSPMRGTLSLSSQKGNITLQRDTARANSPMGRFSAIYTGSGESVDGLTAADCGETLLGIPCEVYERSAFIRQSSLTVDASAELERRIAALITTGEEGQSFSEASAALKKQLNARKYNKSGRIPALGAEIVAQERSLAELSQLTRSRQEAEAALAAFRSHRDYDLISCGMFDEAVAAIAPSHKDKLIARNTGIVRTNLAILDDWVNSSEHFFYTKPQAGTTALVYYDFDIPSYDFCTRMYHETGAFVTPGDCFEQPRSMRIGYASDTGTLKAGLAAITEFAAKLEAK